MAKRSPRLLPQCQSKLLTLLKTRSFGSSKCGSAQRWQNSWRTSNKKKSKKSMSWPRTGNSKSNSARLRLTKQSRRSLHLKTKWELKPQTCKGARNVLFNSRKSLRARFMKLVSSLLLRRRKLYPSRRSLRKNAYSWRMTRKKRWKRRLTLKRKPS